MGESARIVTAAELEKMTPQERSDLVQSSIVRSLDDIPQRLRNEINDTARRLGSQRRARG